MKDGMLEFSDWPMFDRLMEDKALCREVIEIILDEPISDIEYIITEDDVRPTLTNHGVRFDAFVKTKGEIYDIEMQTTKRGALGRRMRYYQSALDARTLHKGENYKKLPPCYIIFICMHDPFGEGLPTYTLDIECREKSGTQVGHGFVWKALSAPAWDKLPEGRLRNLLHYVWTGDAGSDSFTGRLAVAVDNANEDEEWVMEKRALLTLEEDLEIQKQIAVEEGRELGREIGLAEGRAEGREEGLAEGREEGLAEGRAEGLSEGIDKGEARLGALIEKLMSAGRMEDVSLAAKDAAVRRALFAEFDL